IALPEPDDIAVAMSPEAPVVQTIHVEIAVAGNALAICDGIDIQQPAFAGLVLNIARIMKEVNSHTAGLESLEPERVENVVIQSRLAEHLVVSDQELSADEPVSFETIEIPRQRRVDIVFRFERHPATEEIII